MARGRGSGGEMESSPRRVGAEVCQQAPGPEGLSCLGGVGLGQGVGEPKVPGQEVPEAKAREGTGPLRCSGVGWQGEVAPGSPAGQVPSPWHRAPLQACCGMALRPTAQLQGASPRSQGRLSRCFSGRWGPRWTIGLWCESQCRGAGWGGLLREGSLAQPGGRRQVSASLGLRASPVNWEQNAELLERKGDCG